MEAVGDVKNAPVYPIGVVRKLTGLTERQIRYYDRKGLVVPHRTEGKRRLYSRADVEKLLAIKRLLAGGFTLWEAVAHLALRGRPAAVESVEDSDALAHFSKGEAVDRVGAHFGKGLQSVFPITNRPKLLEVVEKLVEPETRRGGKKGSRRNEG